MGDRCPAAGRGCENRIWSSDLRVTLEDVGVPLLGREEVLISDVQDAALEDVHRLGELEVVDVAQDDDVRVLVLREDLVHEVVDDLGLAVPGDLAEPGRRLRGPNSGWSSPSS